MGAHQHHTFSKLIRSLRKNLRRLKRAAESHMDEAHYSKALARLQKRVQRLLAALNPLALLRRGAFTTLALLAGIHASAFAQTPTISTLNPDANELDVGKSSNIGISFSTLMNGSTLTASNIRIYGSQSGYLSNDGIFSGNPAHQFDPFGEYKPGEVLSVTITTGVESAGGVNLAQPEVYRFRAAAPEGIAVFKEVNEGVPQTLGIALGDLDGDGDLDAIQVRTGDSTQRILLNNGDGTFSVQEDGAGFSRDVALGDLDNDGDLDAVIANTNDLPDEIWFNNGDGTFATGSFAGNLESFAVAIGDLDGDGDLDVVLVNSFNDMNDVLLNNGDGTFTTTFFGNGNSRDIALGDLDGDGDLDAIVANDNQAQDIWFNNGDATFTKSTFGGGRSRAVAIGDLDGDGDLDAIIANNSGTSRIWENNGDGTFVSVTFGSSRATDVALGDLDADGDLDAIISNFYGNVQDVWINKGDATFNSHSFGGTKWAERVALGDLDGNGSLDVFFADADTVAQNSLWINFTSIPKVQSRNPIANDRDAARDSDIEIFFSEEMDFATLNSDTDLSAANIFVYGSQSGHIGPAANISSNALGSKATIDPAQDFFPGEMISVTLKDAENIEGAPLTTATVYSFIAAAEAGSGDFFESTFGAGRSQGVDIGDLDGDGDLDALIVTEFVGHEIWLNNGDGSFASSEFKVGLGAADIVLGDLDGDGDLDALVPRSNDNKDQVWFNNGDGTFSTSEFGLEDVSSQGAALGDLDGDGDLDAIIARNDVEDAICLNNGDGTFSTSTFGTDGSQGVAIGDLDGDDDLDVVIAQGRGEPQEIWVNNGDATFASSTFGEGRARSAAIGDLDGDGHLDVIVARAANEREEIWLNNGDGSFSSSTFGGHWSTDIAIGDLDGDGDLDAILSSDYGQPQIIWLNNGDATFATDAIGAGESRGLALGDLDGDGDLDAIIANEDDEAQDVWFNRVTPAITAFDPAANSLSASLDRDIAISFDEPMSATTLTVGADPANASLIVHGSQSGYISGNAALSLIDNGTELVIDLTDDFKPGEEIALTITDAATSIHGLPLAESYVHTFRAKAPGGSGKFARSTFGTGNSRDAGVGDLDGDGDLDAIIANTNASNIWLNNGDGTFATSNFDGSDSFGMELGDLDGDGDLDAVFANLDQAQSIWLNNGDGTFSSSTLGRSNGNSTGLDLGDLDKDGDLDVVITANDQNELWLNNGDGTFATSTFSSGTQDVALGDLDGDGDLDMAFARGGSFSQSNSIWLNDGSASFTSSTFGDGSSTAVALGDLDGDGDLDALFACSSGEAQHIWLNNGDGSFSSSTFGGGNSTNVSLGDLDGDGDLDAIITNTISRQHIYINQGDATFSSSTLGLNRSSYAAALGDLDDDGTLDVIIANTGDPQEIWHGFNVPRIVATTPAANSSTDAPDSDLRVEFSVRMKTSTLTTTANLTLHGMQSGQISNNAAVSYHNGNTEVVIDPAKDFKPGELIQVSVRDAQSADNIAMTTSHVFSFRAAARNGLGSFQSSTLAAADGRNVALGDLDGDGDLDAVIAVYPNAAQQIWLNKGAGSFTTSTFGSGNGLDVAFGDLDGDGDLDAVVAFAGYQPQQIWLNNGDGTFNSQTLGGGRSTGVALGDLDGDGDLDALIADSNNDGQEIWINNGDGSFSSSTFHRMFGQDAALGDLDGDGDLDAMFAQAFSQGQGLWLNNGDGTFVSSEIGAGSSQGVAFGDLDGDGDLDAIVAHGDVADEILLNNGDATFVSSTFGGSGSGSNEIALGDLDGDGDLDAVVSKANAAQEIWLNNGAASFSVTTFGSALGTRGVALGDLNGNGAIDAFLVNGDDDESYLWFNENRMNVASVSPAANVHNAAAGTDITIDFSEEADPATLTSAAMTNNANLIVYGGQTGHITTAATITQTNGNTRVIIDPAADFRAGEEIELIVSGVATTTGGIMHPFVQRFRTGVSDGFAEFTVESITAGTFPHAAELGDLNGDGLLDIFVVDQTGFNSSILFNNGDGTFKRKILSGVFSAEDAALGDLDGDGDLDIIVANDFRSANQIFINNGVGSFNIAKFGPLRVDATSVALGDLDGDGDLDAVISVSRNPSELWLNNGDGTFTSSTFGFGLEPRDVAIGDLDSDGDLDMMIANRDEPQEILLNNGDATFTLNTIGAGKSSAVTLGDLDGDGDLDAIVANDNNNPQDILLNNGDGSFSVGAFGSGYSADVVLGDLDNDGDLDAVIANDNYQAQEIWLNNGDAGFSSCAFGGKSDTRGCAMGDIDNDGDLDVVAMNSFTPTSQIWYNRPPAPQITAISPVTNANAAPRNAAITVDFNEAMDPATLTSATIPNNANLALYGAQSGLLTTAATIAYANGDTRVIIDPAAQFYPGEEIELVVREAQSATTGIAIAPLVHRFRAAVDSGTALFTIDTINTSGLRRGVELGDLNGDGYLDIAMADENVTTARVMFNNGDGSFAMGAVHSLPWLDLKLGDLDGDGDLDIIACRDGSYGSASGNVDVLLNDGSGVFSANDYGSNRKATGLALGDFDGDGDLDAVLSTYDSKSQLLLNNGDGAFSQSLFGATNTSDGIASGDVDNDGDLDLIIAVRDAPQEILLNNGDASFNQQTFGSGQSRGIALGDLDGDGDLDVVIANYDGAQEIWLNNGAGTFTSSAFGSGASHAVELGDFDGDGDLDAVIANENGANELWLNNGDGSFSSAGLGGGSFDVAMGDLDLDGDLDVVVLDAYSETEIWYNLPPRPQIASITPSVTTASLSGAQLSVQGAYFDATTAQITVLDELGETSGTLSLPISSASPIAFNAEVPAGVFATAGTLTLTVGSPTGTTRTTLMVLNDMPRISVTNATATSDEDTAMLLSVNLSDTDPGISGLVISPPVADLVTIASISQVNATSATTSFLITPVTNAFGSVPLTFEVSDGELSSSTTVTLTVNPVNDPPSVATPNQSLTTDEDVATTAVLNLFDIETPLSQLILSATSNNQSVLANGGISFGATGATTTLFLAPATNASGSADITVFVDDGDLVRSTTLRLTVNPVNDAPFISVTNATVTSDEDVATTVIVNVSDIDTPFNQLILRATSNNQSVLQNSGITFGATGTTTTVILDPVADAYGSADITVFVDDGEFIRTTTLSLTVNPVNDAPFVSVTNATVTSDEDVATTAIVNVSDIDTPFNQLILSATSNNQSVLRNSGITIGATGVTTTVILDPVADAHGSADVTVFVDDGEFIRTTTLSLMVNTVNDAPFVAVTNVTVTSDEDVATTAIVNVSDIDTPFNQLLLSATSNNQSVLQNSGITFGITGATTTVLLDPVVDANGQADVTVTVGDGELTRSTTFTLTVNPINDAPHISVTNATVTTDEDVATAAIVNVSDVDTPFDQLLLRATSNNQSVVADGGLSFGSTGATTTLLIEPVTHATGQADITVTVDDGEFRHTTTLTLTVHPVNDAPFVAVTNATVTSDEDIPTTAVLHLSDIETPYSQLILSAVSDNPSVLTNSGVTFGATGATTTVQLDPLADANGQANVTVIVDDGGTTSSTTFTLTVDVVNDAPTLTPPSNQTLPQNGALTAAFAIDDIDSSAPGLVVTATSNNQTLIPNSGLTLSTPAAAMQLTLTPACGQTGTALVTLSVSDGEFTASGSFDVTVQPVSFSPISGDTCGCPGTVMTYSVDPFGAGFTGVWSVVGGAIVSGQNTNAVEVIWDQGGAQSISIDRMSAAGCTTTTSLAMTAKSLDAVLDYATTDGPAVTLDLLSNDTGANIDVESIAVPDNGSLVDHNDGTATYTPDAGFTGFENVSYTIEDASGCQISGTAMIAVTEAQEYDVNLVYEEMQKDGVNGVDGLNQATSVAVSPDGKHLYTTGQGESSVAIFEIDASDGTLTYVGREYHGANGVTDMQLAGSVAVSPDGENVYVTAYSGDAVVVFDRDAADGTLSFAESKKNGQPDNGQTITGLNGAYSVAVSPDGKHVYAAGYSDNSVAIFSRNADGALTYEGRVKDGTGGVDGLYRTMSVTVSPDGKHVYAAGNRDNAVAVFSRNASTGVLTYVERKKDGSGGVDGLRRATCVAVSPDGKHVYATGSGDRAVAAFSRNAADGKLTYIHRLKDGTGGVDGLNGAYAVTVSPDGRHVYVAGETDYAIAVFSRNVTSGALTYVERKKDGTDGVDGLYRARHVATTPDSRYVYGAGLLDHAVCVLYRNRAPLAEADVLITSKNTTKSVDPRTNDTEADGETLTITGVTNGAHGTATTNGSTVTYMPNAGYSGVDSFTYTLSDGEGGTGTGTITVTVNAAKAAVVAEREATVEHGAEDCAVCDVQVMPNPIDDRATISFETHERSYVRVAVVDQQGREVAELTNGWRDAGRMDIDWITGDERGQRAANGVYFVVITTRNASGVEAVIATPARIVK